MLPLPTLPKRQNTIKKRRIHLLQILQRFVKDMIKDFQDISIGQTQQCTPRVEKQVEIDTTKVSFPTDYGEGIHKLVSSNSLLLDDSITLNPLALNLKEVLGSRFFPVSEYGLGPIQSCEEPIV
jgi:hypothetical protein